MDIPGVGNRGAGLDLALGLLVFALTGLTFSGVAGHAFLNWDDQEALVHNAALDRPGLVAWAFSTTHMSHYQPLSWLTLGTMRKVFGAEARAHHLLSLAGHALVAVLVFAVARVVFARILAGPPGQARIAAVGAALLYALHPLRVEVVAWASAFPYILAVAFLLLSFLMYWRSLPEPGAAESSGRLGVRSALVALSLVTYATSLLARPVALAYPAVLFVVDLAARRPWRPSLLEKLPFAALSVMLAMAEANTRAFVGLERTGLLARLGLAVKAPFTYLGRLIWPVSLSPLDALPLESPASLLALVGGVAALGVIGFLAFRAAPRSPWPVAAGVSWLLLLAPAAGLLQSGLAATADRYTYLPDLALGLLGGGAFALAWSRVWQGGWLAAAGLITALGLASVRQLTYWRDSVALWTRAADLDPKNDVALYNLGLALNETGDAEAAARRLRQTLALVPDHGQALQELTSIELRGLEAEAARAAEAGRLREAVELYGRVLSRDDKRVRARASRGMALLQLGQFDAAVADLTDARRLGNREATVASALALALRERGLDLEARDVLEAALQETPGDPGLTHNLARLLSTSEDRAARSPSRALELAQTAERLTQGRDPRVFDTLAAAWAAAGQRERARQAAQQGLELARRLNDADLAAALAARLRSLK